MKLGSKYAFLIRFINTMLSDKDDKYALVMPELIGSVKLDVGNNKRKYMSVKGSIVFPYSMITEEARDVEKIPAIMHYAYMNKSYLSDKASKIIDESENEINNFFKANPEVKIALDNLINALNNAKHE